MGRFIYFAVPTALTWVTINYDLLPDSFVNPIATLVLVITLGVMLLTAGWLIHIKKGESVKCKELWKLIEKDTELWDKKNNITVAIFLLAISMLFSPLYFTTVLLAFGTICAVIQYLRYESKYNDNFSDPSGLV